MEYQKKLDDIERRFEELTAQMADNAVISDSALYRKISKQQSDMSDMVGKYREWKAANRNLQEARTMLQETDPELRAMAQDEVARLEPLLTQYEDELKVLMLPRILLTRRTSSSRSAPGPAAMRLLFLPTNCSACTGASRNRAAGRLK